MTEVVDAIRPGAPGRGLTRPGGYLDDVDRFDAAFFDIPPREAVHVDPQHRLVLGAGEGDAVVHLQSALDRCYERGRYDRSIDYSRDAVPPLRGEDAAWADRLLRTAGRRN